MITVLKSIWNYLKTVSILGVLRTVLFIAMAFYIVSTCQRDRRLSNIAKTNNTSVAPKTEVVQEAEEIAREVDTVGRERVVYRLSKPIIEKIEDKTKTDSLLKELDIEKSKVKAISQVTGNLQKENTELKRTVAVLADGRKDTSYSYTDKWLQLSGVRRADSTIIISKIFANADIDRVDHTRKKNWFWGRNEDVATISYASPYISVNGLKTYTLKQKEPLLDFKIKAEGKYLHGPKELLIGPKLQLRLGRFTIGSGYYINPGGNLGNTIWYGGEYSIY